MHLSASCYFFLTCYHYNDKAQHTVKPVLSGHSKRTPKIGFQYRVSLNVGQKYYRMLQGEYSARLSTSIKLPFSIKTKFCLFISGRLRQVLLYFTSHFSKCSKMSNTQLIFFSNKMVVITAACQKSKQCKP